MGALQLFLVLRTPPGGDEAVPTLFLARPHDEPPITVVNPTAEQVRAVLAG